MPLRISVRTRLTLYVIVLLLAQVILVLFVIQRQEIKAIYEEQEDKGAVLAKSIAAENLRPLVIGDWRGVEENIESRIDEDLIYVVFYDPYNNRPFAGNSLIKQFNDIYQTSHLDARAERGQVFSQRRTLIPPDNGPPLDVLEVEMPVFNPEDPRPWGVIKIGLSLEDLQAEERRTGLLMLLIGTVGLLVGILGATWLGRRITTPLNKLVDGTKKISRGDFSLKIDIDSHDEIGDLARSFNDMSHQLQLLQMRMEEANKRLIQVEKLASIGHISTGIAHEIRNPLTSVKLNIQKLVEKDNLDEFDREYLDISQEGIAQIEKFIKELLNYARVSDLNRDWFSIEQIIDGSIKMIADSLELKKISVTKSYADGLPQVNVDADKIQQVFLNILRNACEVVGVGGKIEIDAHSPAGQESNGVHIEISNNGRAIPEEDWENIFEPFYTTKSSGIGLGLSIARKIIEQHNGSINVINRPGKGTCFQILIPGKGEA